MNPRLCGYNTAVVKLNQILVSRQIGDNVNFSSTNRQIFVVINTHPLQSQFLSITAPYQKYNCKSSLGQYILYSYWMLSNDKFLSNKSTVSLFRLLFISPCVYLTEYFLHLSCRSESSNIS